MTTAQPVLLAPDEDDHRTRALVTPEGVDLRIRIADASRRAAAFLIDAGVIMAVLIGLTIVCVIAGLASFFRPA